MESFERKEIKYLLTPFQYEEFRALAGTHMAPAEYPEGDVSSFYYDTPDDLLINRSIAGGKYKEKLRVRSYGAATAGSEVFVEIKKKLKGIVYKRRVNCTLAAAQAFLAGMPYEEAIERWPLASVEAREECRSWKSLQVAGEIAWMRDHYDGLAPKMLVSTHRTSFVDAERADVRITFDADVRWNSVAAVDSAIGAPTLEHPQRGRDLFAGGERILEVKCANGYPMWLVEALDACGIRPQSVSKYGRAYQAAMAEVQGQSLRELALRQATAQRAAASTRVRGTAASQIAASVALPAGIAFPAARAFGEPVHEHSRTFRSRLSQLFPRSTRHTRRARHAAA